MAPQPAYSIKILYDEEKNSLAHFLDLTTSELNSKLLNEKHELGKWILEQALRRKKIQHKLPSLFNDLNLVIPPTLHLEQCSSETTAIFKATLFKGERFIDFTAGFGIDSLYLKRGFKHGILLELNTNLCDILQHNISVLELENLRVLNSNCEDFLRSDTDTYDLGYIDPARRNELGGKVVYLSDYTPNVLSIQEDLLKKCSRVLLKTSPLLDIKKAIHDLKTVSDVYVVSVDNECKELLFVLTKHEVEHANIHAICLNKIQTKFTFNYHDEYNAVANYTLPQSFLYEPDAAILKAGAFQQIACAFGLKKLHKHTHLYTSDTLIEKLPGRTFSIQHVCKPDKKELIQFIPSLTMNLSIRNFPMAVDMLKKKLNVQDGGAWYVFGCTLQDESKRLILCKKLN